MSIAYKKYCPGCGAVVVCDPSKHLIGHEFPECAWFLSMLDKKPPALTHLEMRDRGTLDVIGHVSVGQG